MDAGDGSSNPLARFGFHIEPHALIEINGRAYYLEEGYSVREGQHGLVCVFRVDTERLIVSAGKQPNVYLGQDASLELPAHLPSVLELGGSPFSLRVRLPVTVDAIGTPTGLEEHRCIWGEYHADSGQMLWVLSSSLRAEALVAERVSPHDITYWETPS